MKLPLAAGKYRKPARLISRSFLFVALAAWFFHIYVFYQYDSKLPAHVDSRSGRLYPQNNHGHVVYLTQEEESWLTNLRIAAAVLAAVGVLISTMFAENLLWPKTPPPWGKKQF